jgi:aspartyl-tRNA(Asn)/glutamyl-tRNA(Gln) amidotransferase subunit A
MMQAPGSRTISGVAPLLRAKSVSPVDLVRQCLTAIDRGREGNAFITVMRERALEEAERAARDIAAGRYIGPLHGIPLAIKDLIDIEGTATTSGSRVPARHPSVDAPVIRRLRDAGAIIIGKTNLHEFAFGTTSDETAFGPVRHPQDPARSAGGSSGGSAAALVEGMCLGAVGTDTGGSIRIPASACGIVGLKPTFAELATDGVVPLSTTLDHVGPMARTVGDVGLLFQAMKGATVQGVAAAGGRLTFGIPRRYFFDRLDPAARGCVDEAIAKIREAGYAAHDVDIQHAEWTPHVYLHIVLPEAADFHARGLAEHADLYSPGVRLRLEMGRYLLAEDYVRAMRLRDVLTQSVARALERYDALILPTLPIAAPPIGAATVNVDGTDAPVRATMLSLTQLFNLTGHPAISLPAGLGADGLPRGIQIVGHRGRTERLLDVASAVEEIIHLSRSRR